MSNNKRKIEEINDDNYIKLITDSMNKNLKIDPEFIKDFFQACKENNLNKINFYLSKKDVSFFLTNELGNTPLIECIKNNSTNSAITLIKSKKSNFNHCNLNGFDALFYACEYKNYDIVKLLFKIPNIKVDFEKLNFFISNDILLHNLFQDFKQGKLRKMKFKDFNPWEVDNNPQREFRSNLINFYKNCVITGEKSEKCDFLHIVNPKKNNLEPFNFYNGIIMSQEFHRKYYKNKLIKFNKNTIRIIDSKYLGIQLETNHPDLVNQYNEKEIKFHINSLQFFQMMR